MSYLKTKQPTEIVAVLDRSGSMQAIVNDAIGGFNRFLATQQDHDGEATMTMILFDTEYTLAVDNKPLHQINPLTNQTFKPRGMTALHDAMGRALTDLLQRSPPKAIVAILTDGEENSSKEYTREQVRKLTDQARAKGYEIMYLAANQDAIKVGERLGVTRAVNFAATGAGVNDAYTTLAASATAYRNDGVLPPPPK